MLSVPIYEKSLSSGNLDTLPITINSDKANAEYPKTMLFIGNVKIKYGSSTLIAKQAELHQVPDLLNHIDTVSTVTAYGGVLYNDSQIILTGQEALSNLNTKDTDVYKGSYQIIGLQGRGKASKMTMRGDRRYIIVENGTFTSCLPGDNSWSVLGSKVVYDRADQVAKIWNARFHIGNVPVFYAPYFQLPIGNKRRSGLLTPHIKYSTKNGLEFMLPYYWSIAPNYDATFTAHYISKRGLQWQNELRYLVFPGSGLIALDWLAYNQERKQNKDKNSTRWFLYWTHEGLIDQAWRFNIDFIKASDVKYFNDLNDKHVSITDGYATQKFTFGYGAKNWNATLSSKQFQIFDNKDYANSYSYIARPQLDFNYYKNNLGPFDFHLYSQAMKFISINPYSPNSTRLHIEPTINLALISDWAKLTAEAKLLASHYHQSIPNYFTVNYVNRDTTDYYPALGSSLKKSVNRVLPQLKIDSKMLFDRQIIWPKGSNQTLESRAQYLYVPYRDQSNIYIYDTTPLQTDYLSLFRDYSFSGLDRIASQNRASVGLTTRIYDDALIERFNASVNQSYYFSRSRSGDKKICDDNTDRIGSLLWTSDAYWKIHDRWILQGGLQYNTFLRSISISNAMLSYCKDSQRVVQINYRYATPEYISAALSKNKATDYKNTISQIGVRGTWPITDRWEMLGAYYYDMHSQKTENHLLRLTYNTCCWAVVLGYERKINDWNNRKNTSVYEKKVSFNLELRSLGSDANIGSTAMLRSSILPY